MPGTSDTSDKRSVTARALRTRQDTERFLARFAALTGLRVTSATAESLPRAFLARTVAPPDLLVESYGRELALRTSNALRRFEPAPPGEPWTFGRLLQIRGFGLFCLLDVLEVMARHGAPTRPAL